MRSSFVVGLTGGIGSGKSTVAAAFTAKGADVLDADDVAHAVSRRGESGHRAIVDALGREFEGPDGELDRARLRRRAFDDAAFRTWLEALLHPLIEVRIDAQVNRWRAAYGVLVVPLLLERGRLRSTGSRGCWSSIAPRMSRSAACNCAAAFPKPKYAGSWQRSLPAPNASRRPTT